MKRILPGLLSLVLLLTLVGCGSAEPAKSGAAPAASAQPTKESGSVAYEFAKISVGTTGSIEKAVRGEYNYDMLASGTTEPPLVRQDSVGDYHPLVAEFRTEDAVTWTYTVLPGMFWDDGEPVTAEDILFTLQYDEADGSAVFEDKTDSEGNVTKAKYTGYTLSEDGRSISLTLNAPNVRELSNMTSFRVMPKHIYEGKTEVSEAEARVGCGPYRFEAFSAESGTVTFAANPLYPEKQRAEKLVFRIFGNEDTMYLSLENGDIDLTWNYSAGVSANYLEILKSVDIYHEPAVNEPAVLAFNNSRGPFANEALRKAVSCALNYEAFRTYFGSEGAEIPNRGFVPNPTLGFTETEKLTTDTAAAENYMKEAGCAGRNGEGFFVNADGEPVSFRLTYNAAKENHVGCAELIKTQLEEFGIRVELDACDKDSYNAKTSSKFSENNVTMEAALYGYTAAGMGMGSGLGSIYVDGSHAVQGGCQVFDEEFIRARDKMANAVTLEQYREGAAELQRFYAEHVPLLALYWDDISYACSPKLRSGRPYVSHEKIDALFGLNNVVFWTTEG